MNVSKLAGALSARCICRI